MMQKRTFQIYRYDPDKDAKPYMQSIEVELDGNERMLLDALMKLKAVDPSISFRRSCREGVCGSDAMNINGKNGLACLTNMNTLPAHHARPLPGLPVIRDLIVDMTSSSSSSTTRSSPTSSTTTCRQKERLQSPQEREELNGLYECILCASCSTQLPHPSGGTLTSSSARPACCRPTGSSPTAATRPQPSAWTTWKTPTACSAAARS
jgi:succinate dehydrogenase / fumarate reductase iron-sulfur subunit